MAAIAESTKLLKPLLFVRSLWDGQSGPSAAFEVTMTSKPSVQTAYHVSRSLEVGDVDEEIYLAMRHYLRDDLGLSEEFAERRARAEMDRANPKYVVGFLRESGVDIRGREVLDLGAGLGGMSEELALQGANLKSLEPGKAWGDITRRRVQRHATNFQMIQGYGEELPIADHSIDVIVSLQVLEHVKDPAKVLSEAWRVLKPGGHFYLACENYLAFWEGHYKVAWFPLMPKTIASLYLKARGRSPVFLNEAVTYVTYPWILFQLSRLGFHRVIADRLIANAVHGTQLKSRLIRTLGPKNSRILLDVLTGSRYAFRFGVRELLVKPG